jgi:hypothetical protein
MAHEIRCCQVSLCDEEIISNLISDDIFSEVTLRVGVTERVNVLSEENSKVDEKGCFVAYKLCPFQFIFGL